MTNAQKQLTALPFLKWAGGKGQLLKQYDEFFPKVPMRYYFEPFVGSGAVFFHLRGHGLFEHYSLSDVNKELINCYQIVKNEVEELIKLLAVHKKLHTEQGKEYYYQIRAKDRESQWKNTSPVERAARMIYLNKTCFNGLWRVNSQGQFNVPMGRYKAPDILNEDRLLAASAALQGVELKVSGFEQVLEYAQEGDFVYFDPPYVPLSPTANFTSYSADSFGESDQRHLADIFAKLDKKGCRVMLSNSDTRLVRELYQAFHFGIKEVNARRAISSNGSDRGPITEVVVLNYEPSSLKPKE